VNLIVLITPGQTTKAAPSSRPALQCAATLEPCAAGTARHAVPPQFAIVPSVATLCEALTIRNVLSRHRLRMHFAVAGTQNDAKADRLPRGYVGGS